MHQLIIAGSRDITDVELIRGIMNQAWKDLGPYEVISGDARGVDITSARIAMNAGITVHHYPADWDKYGKSAGYRRNEYMAKDATHVLAIWDGVSKGTGHMIDIADKAGVPVRIVDLSKE